MRTELVSSSASRLNTDGVIAKSDIVDPSHVQAVLKLVHGIRAHNEKIYNSDQYGIVGTMRHILLDVGGGSYMPGKLSIIGLDKLPSSEELLKHEQLSAKLVAITSRILNSGKPGDVAFALSEDINSALDHSEYVTECISKSRWAFDLQPVTLTGLYRCDRCNQHVASNLELSHKLWPTCGTVRNDSLPHGYKAINKNDHVLRHLINVLRIRPICNGRIHRSIVPQPGDYVYNFPNHIVDTVEVFGKMVSYKYNATYAGLNLSEFIVSSLGEQNVRQANET